MSSAIFSPFETEVYNTATKIMQNNTTKLTKLSKYENGPGVEAWFQWELMLDPLFYTKWKVCKRRDYDLKIVDKTGKYASPIKVELKSVTGHDFNTRVKKWYNPKGNSALQTERKNIPILFLSRSRQQKNIDALRENNSGYICNYANLNQEWIIGICKPT